MNYKTELDKMLDEVIRRYGHESREAIRIATMIDKCYENCNEEKFRAITVVYSCLMKKS